MTLVPMLVPARQLTATLLADREAPPLRTQRWPRSVGGAPGPVRGGKVRVSSRPDAEKVEAGVADVRAEEV